jgi:hypothetical protein
VANKNWSDNSVNVEEFESKPGKMGDTACTNNSQNDISILYDFGMDGAGDTAFCGKKVGLDCGSDSDGDGIPDFYEKKYFGTKPGVADSDSDGTIDGLEVGWIKAVETAPGSGVFHIVKGTVQSKYNPQGIMTDPTNPDTDGDKLCDGNCGPLNQEVKNCIGPSPQLNAKNQPINTDPRAADSDGDGMDDYEEGMSSDRSGTSLDVSRALSPERGGCGIAGGSGGETWGMTLMFAAMLVATKAAALITRRTKKARSRR